MKRGGERNGKFCGIFSAAEGAASAREWRVFPLPERELLPLPEIKKYNNPSPGEKNKAMFVYY